MTETPPPKSPPPKNPSLLMLGAGTMFASMILSGFLLGYWLDTWLDTLPIFMVLFAGLGLVGGAIKVLKLLNAGSE